jgi:hypothetical protein
VEHLHLSKYILEAMFYVVCSASVAAQEAYLLLEVAMRAACACVGAEQTRDTGPGGGTLAPAPREQNTLGLRGGALIFKCGSSAITARIVTH